MKDLPKQEIIELIRAAPNTKPTERITYRGFSICAVMASWNEAGKVEKGVKQVPRNIVDTIVVVNNGSEDNTAQLAKEAGAVVINHPFNLGAGGGYRSGFIYGFMNKFDLIVELAGDNQDDPSDIGRVVDYLIDNRMDYVHGSRWLKYGQQVNMPLSRIVLTKFYSFLFRFFFKKKITDATNGFRVFKASILNNRKINLWQQWLIQYELEPYLLIKSVQLGYRVGETHVKKKYHVEMKSNTKMVPIKSWFSILRPLFILKMFPSK